MLIGSLLHRSKNESYNKETSFYEQQDKDNIPSIYDTETIPQNIIDVSNKDTLSLRSKIFKIKHESEFVCSPISNKILELSLPFRNQFKPNLVDLSNTKNLLKSLNSYETNQICDENKLHCNINNMPSLQFNSQYHNDFDEHTLLQQNINNESEVTIQKNFPLTCTYIKTKNLNQIDCNSDQLSEVSLEQNYTNPSDQSTAYTSFLLNTTNQNKQYDMQNDQLAWFQFSSQSRENVQLHDEHNNDCTYSILGAALICFSSFQTLFI